LTQSGLSAL